MTTTGEKRLIATFMNYASGRPLTDKLLNTLYNDWNSLMPVVEKIELMNKGTGMMGVFTLYGLGRTKVQCYKNELFCYEVDVIDKNYGIQPTYQAAVKFIEWYNKNK